MGGIISRFRKSQTTTEILEDIDRNITHLEKFRKANQDLRQKVIGKLILYSVMLYICGAFGLYFFFMPQEWTYRLYGLLPFFFFPFLVYLLKRFLHWFFVRKISQNEGELQVLRDRRKEILENVMETETYKKAKEILEKFDPETKKKMEDERMRKENEEKAKALNQNQKEGLRRRQVVGHPVHPGSPGVPVGRGRGMPAIPMSPMTPTNGVGRGQNARPISPVTGLPRPILPLNKTPLDKLMDYMIGDGTSHRYALICQHCANHNGMALKEEFEYMAFRCAYCRFFNPARKQRPNAPRLPMPSPRIVEVKPTTSSGSDDECEQGTSSGSDGTAGQNDEESQSEACAPEEVGPQDEEGPTVATEASPSAEAEDETVEKVDASVS